MVVQRAGGASKRTGTKFVLAVGTSTGYTLTIPATLTVAAFASGGIVATLLDPLGAPVTTRAVTWETDDATLATVASTGPLTGAVTGVSGGTVRIRARVAALGLVSNDCVATVTDAWIVHTFSTPGTTALDVTAGSGNAEALVVAGGGSGGGVDGTGVNGGGGGAGGLLHFAAYALAVGSYQVIVGAGGPQFLPDSGIGVPGGSNPGADSVWDGNRVFGGGGGGSWQNVPGGVKRDGGSGGSGGGAGSDEGVGFGTDSKAGGFGTAGQGNNGGDGQSLTPLPLGGGGGGAGGAGNINGANGAGLQFDIENIPGGTLLTYAQGGDCTTGGAGANATAPGFGGQGGGAVRFAAGGAGANGRVVIRYKLSTGIVATGGVITTFPV